MHATVDLSPDQARKIVLLSQGLPPRSIHSSAEEKTLDAIQHLGYIQIDTISAVQRAHHHTLWNRNPRYRSDHLDRLLRDGKIFEYWSHAAAYLPMEGYRYSLRRKHAIASGQMDHWYPRDPGLMREILRRIEAEGPLMARDFGHEGKRIGEWGAKPAKQALEYLFMQGELMIPCRSNFQKVYDLTCRVLPKHVDRSMPSEDEYTRFLITGYLKAHGLGTAGEISYLLKGMRSPVADMIAQMTGDGELIEVRTCGTTYAAFPSSLELLDRRLSRRQLKILSPFDNLIIQRKRTKQIFAFEYLLECYIPPSKRRFGYFSLPILFGGRLVARMDCRADRKTSVLHINHLAVEPALKDTDGFLDALKKELIPFMRFNRCTGIVVHQTTAQILTDGLQTMMIGPQAR